MRRTTNANETEPIVFFSSFVCLFSYVKRKETFLARATQEDLI